MLAPASIRMDLYIPQWDPFRSLCTSYTPLTFRPPWNSALGVEISCSGKIPNTLSYERLLSSIRWKRLSCFKSCGTLGHLKMNLSYSCHVRSRAGTFVSSSDAFGHREVEPPGLDLEVTHHDLHQLPPEPFGAAAALLSRPGVDVDVVTWKPWLEVSMAMGVPQ